MRGFVPSPCGETHPCKASVDLDLDNLALDDFCFLLDAYADASPNGLRERFGFGHGERKDFAASDHRKRDARAERLCHAYERGQDASRHDHEEVPSAMAVLPVDGGPANRMARPAIRPSWTILRIMPAALRALAWPTMPWAFPRGSSRSSRPRPRMCECAPGGKMSGQSGVCGVGPTYPLHLSDVSQLRRPCCDLGSLCMAMTVSVARDIVEHTIVFRKKRTRLFV